MKRIDYSTYAVAAFAAVIVISIVALFAVRCKTCSTVKNFEREPSYGMRSDKCYSCGQYGKEKCFSCQKKDKDKNNKNKQSRIFVANPSSGVLGHI